MQNVFFSKLSFNVFECHVKMAAKFFPNPFHGVCDACVGEFRVLFAVSSWCLVLCGESQL